MFSDHSLNLYQKFKQGSDEFSPFQLTWESNFTGKQVRYHKDQLEQANACGQRVRVLFRYDGTHARSIIFSELKIPSDSDPNRATSLADRTLRGLRARLLKVFLRAKKDAAKPYYDITEHLFAYLDGDLKVAKALSGREIVVLWIETNPNQPYDLLSNDGTQRLIEEIYQPYFRLFSDYFGKTIAGIQIQPPDLLDYTEYNARIPWTPELPEFFSQMKKYDLFEHISLLFHETYDSATIRHDFWQVLTHLCSLKYVSTMREWANEHGIKLAISQPLHSRSFNRNAVMLSQNADLLSVHQSEKDSDLKDTEKQILFRQASNSPFAHLPFYHFASQSVSRMDLLIGSSRQDSKILVIYPMSSFWVKSRRQDVRWILQSLVQLDEMLKGWGYDYDYGDEDLIAKYGKIDRGNRTLAVGQNSYSVVIVPPCITLQESTVKLLTEFISAKGKLIALKPLPYLLKGKVGSDPYPLESLLYHRRTKILPEDSEQLKNRLKKTVDKKLKPELKFYLRPDNSRTYFILQHRRKCGKLFLYFLLNSSLEKRKVLLEFNSEVSLEEWHLIDGSCSQPDQWHADDKTYTELNFDPKQLRILTARG